MKITELLKKKIITLNLISEKDGQNFPAVNSCFFDPAKWNKIMQSENNVQMSKHFYIIGDFWFWKKKNQETLQLNLAVLLQTLWKHLP